MKLKEFLQNPEIYVTSSPEPRNLILETEILDQIDDLFLDKIADLLSKIRNLQSLDLQYGFIGSRDAVHYEIFFNALSSHPELKKLDLSFNHVGCLKGDDLFAFNRFISNSNLEYLSLIDNELDQLNYEEFKNLFTAIKQCKTLKYLYIGDNRLSLVDESKFKLMCNALIECVNLVNLEKFFPYHSKEREDELLKIKQLVAQRIILNNSGFNTSISNMLSVAITDKPSSSANLGSNLDHCPYLLNMDSVSDLPNNNLPQRSNFFKLTCNIM